VCDKDVEEYCECEDEEESEDEWPNLKA
jgi:hypothetical protein